MPLKLHAYILRQILVSLAFAIGGMSFVALPGVAVGAVSKLPNTDVVVVLYYLPLVLQGLAPLVLPIGFMLAVVATYGRLAADNEWTSIQMAGVRPLSLLLSPALLAVVLGGATYFMVSRQLPDLKRQQQEYVVRAARLSIMNLSPGRRTVQMGGFYLRGASREGDLFRDVYIHKPADKRSDAYKAYARTARLYFHDDDLHIELEGVEPIDAQRGMRASFDKMSVVVSFQEYLREGGQNYTTSRYLTSPQISARLAAGRNPESGITVSAREERKLRYEFHHRIALSSVFLMFLGLGAPTGIIMRRGTQLGALAVSIGYALAYYILSMRLGKGLGRSGAVPPELGAWATLTLGSIGAWILVIKAMKR